MLSTLSISASTNFFCNAMLLQALDLKAEKQTMVELRNVHLQSDKL